jgi:hypothetical protein
MVLLEFVMKERAAPCYGRATPFDAAMASIRFDEVR